MCVCVCRLVCYHYPHYLTDLWSFDDVELLSLAVQSDEYPHYIETFGHCQTMRWMEMIVLFTECHPKI